MSVKELDASTFSILTGKARGAPRISLHWDSVRIEVLRAKASAQHLAEFECAGARGQLAAAAGDFDEAERVLLSILHEFKRLYPDNPHFFTHIVQLALAMQALDLVGRFLNDRYGTPDMFLVTFGQATSDPAINLVTVDDTGRCHFTVDPRIPGTGQADYFVGHWLSSAPLWVSYCRGRDWEAGQILMNSGEAGGAPGLAYCGNKPEHILVPDAYFLNWEGYRELRASYSKARMSWESRQAVAFWRGSNTGIRAEANDWESLQRIQMCRLALKHPDVLDAGISRIVQVATESERQEIKASGLMREYATPEHFLKFKYQIDIDGNSNAWPGLYQRLLTGSPVLKVASPRAFRQWYYDRLKPWINYVPVQSDMSDLVDKINWLRTHDSDAHAIGQAGLELAESLDYQRELDKARHTIRAGFRRTAAKPEMEYHFGSNWQENDVLAQGWDAPEPDQVWALGSHSLIALPRPIATVDYELSLDLQPHVHAPQIMAQKVVIAANGLTIAEENLEQRKIVRCRIPKEIVQAEDHLTILILHPGGFASPEYRPIRDDRVKSVALHSLSVMERAIAQRQAHAGTEVLMGSSGAAVQRPATPSRQSQIMRTLYGRDVWSGHIVSRAAEDAVQGWNGNHPCFRRLLLAAPEKTFIDVGVWKGQSTICMANAVRELELDGCVIAIDTFLGSVEHWGRDGDLFDRLMGMPNLYQTFCANVISHGVADLVVPMPQTTLIAAQILRQRHISAGVVHIDASHEYEDVIKDLRAYWHLVAPGGFLVGGDYHPTWSGVMRAADEFAPEVGCVLEIDHPKFIVQKPSNSG